MNQKGMTLIELIISMSIFTVIFAGLMSFLYTGTVYNERTMLRVDLAEQQRNALNRILSDLRAATGAITPLYYSSPTSDIFWFPHPEGAPNIIYWVLPCPAPNATKQCLFRFRTGGNTILTISDTIDMQLDLSGTNVGIVTITSSKAYRGAGNTVTSVKKGKVSLRNLHVQ